MAANQYTCTQIVVDTTPDALIVSNLGEASWVLSEVKDRRRNFYMRGGMGCTTPTAFGLAMTTDEEVVSIDGDGSLLMSLGCLSTVSEYPLPNFTIVVWNNEAYATTGGQPAASTDFGAIAEDMGIKGYTAHTDEEFEEKYAEAAGESTTTLVDCKVELAQSGRPRNDYSHSMLKHRFRSAVLPDVTDYFAGTG